MWKTAKVLVNFITIVYEESGIKMRNLIEKMVKISFFFVVVGQGRPQGMYIIEENSKKEFYLFLFIFYLKFISKIN